MNLQDSIDICGQDSDVIKSSPPDCLHPDLTGPRKTDADHDLCVQTASSMPIMIFAIRPFRSCRGSTFHDWRNRIINLSIRTDHRLLVNNRNSSGLRFGGLGCLKLKQTSGDRFKSTIAKADNFKRNQTSGCRFKSTVAPAENFLEGDSDGSLSSNEESLLPDLAHIPKTEIHRLRRMRNVGIFAHVDAGKTTVTERMLALAGIVARAGKVDDGSTVTDYLPAERERGITIQSAAIRFPWAFHNAQAGELANDRVSIALIDTPGHVDFSVEVVSRIQTSSTRVVTTAAQNRSVAVLDGAVLVVDAAAGVQAQTQTVWRAMTRPSLNNHSVETESQEDLIGRVVEDHFHEPLPCVVVINKMDKVGSDFHKAVQSLRDKLPGANPIPIQLPVFKSTTADPSLPDTTENILLGLVADYDTDAVLSEEFLGVVDLIHMRIIIWPENPSSHDVAVVENCLPTVIPLWTDDHELIYPDCPITRDAIAARSDLVAAIAEVDEIIEAMFLGEQEPSTTDLRQAIRKATVRDRILPVMASAAVQGKCIEPVLDAIADFLPSPIDRMPPSLTRIQNNGSEEQSFPPCDGGRPNDVTLGHCCHPTLLALAFKVLHMKGRGGSGDGRIVFARVYSGKLRCRDSVQVITPPAPGEKSGTPRVERVGGMLELTHFDNLEPGEALSGDVCALVGLKTVVTGDTIMISPVKSKKSSKPERTELAYCAGVTAPKPVLTVKLEAESATEQTKLTEALSLMSIEDPSLIMEETDSCTLLSGLGELHIEVTLDRIRREHGLNVLVGAPSVTYRETVMVPVETDGLVNYDRTVGDSHFQASIQLKLDPLVEGTAEGTCRVLTDPVVTVSDEVLEFLGFRDHEGGLEELELRSEVIRSLLEGCRGALKRGPSGYGMANMTCHVVSINADSGSAGLHAMPGSLRAAAAYAIQQLLEGGRYCCVLEPKMSIELLVVNELVGAVLSDLTGRRGTVEDVLLGDAVSAERKALVRGEVPLIEILGYANSLRSLTRGEATYTSEYKGHAPCMQ